MKIKNSFVRWLSLFLLIVAVMGVTVVSADEPVPAASGLVLEDLVIVVPAHATDVEETAAMELKHYLQEITGTAPGIRVEGGNVNAAIYIGATDYAEAHGVTFEDGAFTDNNGLGEGWVIKQMENSLVLNGGARRGVLYAVYHLLEDQLGVRWWNYWEEYVPSMEDAVLPYGFEDNGEPVFGYREVYNDGYVKDLFTVRNRGNGANAKIPESFGGQETFGLPYHVHTMGRYFPPFYKEPASESEAYFIDGMNPNQESYFLTHPEWFAYSASKEERFSSGQLCLSNQELIEELTRKVLQSIELSYAQADQKGIPRPRYFDISNNDGAGECECDVCTGRRETYGDSGHLLLAYNQVANAVAEKYPEIIMETLAYVSYLEAPKGGIIPADNMLIRLAESKMDVFQGLDHPHNADALRRMHDWAAICEDNQLMYWDYGLTYNYHGVEPNMFRYFSFMQELDKNNGWGFFVELERCNDVDFWDMKNWMMVKLMEDPWQDEETLMMDFLNGYYGAAAGPAIYDFLCYAHEKALLHETHMDFLEHSLYAEWLSAEDVLTLDNFFEEAVANLNADTSLTEEERELYLNRVGAARAGIDRTIMENFTDYVVEMGKYNDPNRIFSLDRIEVGRRMVKATKWLIEMKLEDDYTGLQTNVPQRTKLDGSGKNVLTYVHRGYLPYSEPEDTGYNTVYEAPEVPEQIYADHPGIDDKHIYDFPATAIQMYDDWYAFHQRVDYAASFPNGQACKLDFAVAMEETERKSMQSYQPNFTISEMKPMVSTLPGLYLNNPVVADGEYHLYRLKDVVAVTEASTKITFFGWTGWSLDLVDYEQLFGKKVDVYLSMKVTGDPTGTDPNNYHNIYIDRIIVVEPCGVYDMETTHYADATCANNAQVAGYCPLCGQRAIVDIEGTRLPHNFEGDYTYNQETGCYEGYCSGCDDIASVKLQGELPADVLAELQAEGVGLDRVLDFDVTSSAFKVTSSYGFPEKVADPKSLVKQAVKWDLTKKPKLQNIDYFYILDDDPLETCTRFPRKLYAKDIIVDNEYHYYKMEDVPLVVENSAMSYIHFFDWTLKATFDHLTHLVGKEVDVYFSLRVDGELDFANGQENMPTYYIDRILIVEPCLNHVAEEYTFDAATGKYTGSCTTCGKDVELDNISGELPEDMVNELEADKVGLAHIREYNAEDFKLAVGVTKVDDATSVIGSAVKVDSVQVPMNVSVSPSVTLGNLTAEQLTPNVGDGYHMYKLDNVVVYPESGFNYLWMWNWGLQVHGDKNQANGLKNELAYLAGKEVDLYVSLRMDGSTGPAYLDRLMIVDACENCISEADMTVSVEADCTENEIRATQCPTCGKTVTKEVPNSKLGHAFAGDYVFNAQTGQYEATCTRDGCGEKVALNTVSAELPAELISELKAAGIGLEHTYDYDVDDFVLNAAQGVTRVEDKDSALGYAAKAETISLPMQISPDSGLAVTRLTKSQMEGNVGKGYVLYKLDDVIPVKTANLKYLHMWRNGLQNHKIAEDLAHLRGKKVDLYLSIKIDSLTGPAYLDRMIVVDTCENHIDNDAYKPAVPQCSGKLEARCPVCSNIFTKAGEGGGHKFTQWECDGISGGEKYIGYCDYGCGAKDVKIDPLRYDWNSLLPEGVPREHVIGIYTAQDLIMTGKGQFLWDEELGRGVPVRDRAVELGRNAQLALDMANGSTAIIMGMESDYGTTDLGKISGTEIIANAGKGYCLYSMKGVVPIVYPSYNYFFAFTDWDFQFRSMDDHLITNYKNKKIDIYWYMKVEGDPTCKDLDNQPRYSIGQVIVAESCQTDETWVTTKEPTCTTWGEMVGDCAICGRKGVVMSVPPTDHVITDGYLTTEATCYMDAIQQGACSICGTARVKTPVKGTQLEHSFLDYHEDAHGNFVSYCAHGCGARDFRVEEMSDDDTLLPEELTNPMVGTAILGGAAGGKVFSFSDVKETDWFYDEVRNAWENDLINGVTATEFRPNESLTTAQAIKLAAALHQMYYRGEVTLTNGAGNWYDTYVAYALDNGIIDSTVASYGADKMNSAITRSDFVAIFAKSLEEGCFEGYNQVADNAIPDVKMTDKNADAIYTFYRAGILTGSDGAGTFNPASSIKRSEVAAILIRMYDTSARQAITLN